jgi:hypothetical protein
MPNDSVETAFSKALQLTIPELAFPDSGKLVAQRLAILQQFNNPQLGPAIVSQVETAIETTEWASKICEQFAQISKRILEIDKSSTSLFIIAAEKLDKLDAILKSIPDEASNDKIQKIRMRVLSLIIKGIEEGSNNTVIDQLKKGFDPSDHTEWLAAVLRAELLVAQQKQLSTIVNGLLPAIAQWGLIWRGLFYAAVVDIAGGSLEKKLLREKLLEIVSDLAPKLLSANLSEIYDYVKTMLELLDARNKVRLVGNVVENMVAGQEYLVLYSQALSFWIERAVVIADVEANLLRACVP